MTTTADAEPITLAVRESEPMATGSIAAFASGANYEAAKKMAVALSNSTIVPEAYRGEKGAANCLIALELAARTGASVMMVMQNVHVIQGKPSWSAAFLIGAVNSSGKFSPIRYEIEGEPGKDGCRCRAYAMDVKTGDKLDGEWITWDMVKAEGWLGKPGSKWKTMPGQMIRYRAASFWSRVYAPEISLGMHTAEEAEDITTVKEPSAGTKSLNAALGVVTASITDDKSINGADVACEACGAKPYDAHTDACPHNPIGD